MPATAIEKDAKHKMDGALEALDHELNTLRTGRASAALVQDVEVNAYGAQTPLNQVASISVPDARTVMIQPWDKSIMSSVEKAILAANLGVTPNNDGQAIRINIPTLTEDRRKELVKQAHAMGEHARVAVRNVRRHSNDELKKLEKDSEISEDERDRVMQSIQEITDKHIEEISNRLDAKEKEIMEI